MLMLLIYAVFALGVVIAPGALLGYVLVLASGRLPRGARVALLLALAAGSAPLWLLWETVSVVGPPIVAISFTATLISGFVFLGRDSRRRLALRVPAPMWPGMPPADPK
ncbi:hypothetical protein ACH4U5_01255 [Streptomyces sp. NPDC020858]|uniref:hypothetical protein n=1 Tax=Streptomyces sp. NPDC020858 TaxID=3365097 RepID=UPI0037A7B6A7